MSKVFTITEGLENLGALKTGGQGSIYRAKRIGPIITAVKLLPTPILSEDMSDKNYRDFRNEVEKLKKVNELPNPNVVRILNFGVSETGSFPFIEMEFIEGPDLEELLKPPHDAVFTIKETIRVAEHLANALAHCHRVDVKHGDIKSNNVKFNVHTGNYVLLDFGLALMSDEQRRTSLRYAGAAEFMAPEQSNGQLLFQSDIYSYGIILYELLAGQVPFPLESKAETTRNMVLLAHMETPPPDMLLLRGAHIPSAWPEDRREHEMQLPQWLLDMIRKCVEKDPARRFANGIELYEHILRHSTAIAQSDDLTELLRQENRDLRKKNEQLQQELKTWSTKAAATPPAPAFQPVYQQTVQSTNGRRWQVPVILAVLAALVAIFLVAKSYYQSGGSAFGGSNDTMSQEGMAAAQPLDDHTPKTKEGRPKATDTVYLRSRNSDSFQQQQGGDQPGTADEQSDNQEDERDNTAPLSSGRHYVVAAPRAYFHSQPDPDTRRDAYLTPSDEIMTALDEQGDYVYIVFTNDQGQTSKGWVQKSDLRFAE